MMLARNHLFDNPTIKTLSSELLNHGFIVVDKTKTSLIAKLAERVVIDAIIRFSIGSQLEKRFIHVFRLVSTRTGLGHGAEYFLAVVSFLTWLFQDLFELYHLVN